MTPDDPAAQFAQAVDTFVERCREYEDARLEADIARAAVDNAREDVEFWRSLTTAGEP